MVIKNYIPLTIYNKKILNDIYAIQQGEIDIVYTDVQDLINQCFISTATWGLSYWELEFGIATIETDSYEIRRSRIMAKIRSNATCTPAMIKNVAESFSNGTVDVIEDPANYCFTIKFVSTKGIPPKLSDLQNAIEQIKPAHLGVNYAYTYNTWGMVESKCATWGDLKTWAATWGDGMVKDL